MASFEENLEGLESVVERLERGELTLAESVRLFEDGVALSNACRVELAAAEGKIQVLVDPAGSREAIRPLVLDEEDAPTKQHGEDELNEN